MKLRILVLAAATLAAAPAHACDAASLQISVNLMVSLGQHGEGVDVGANAVIIGAVRIGDRAVIGAGSVVVKDVPPGAVVAGNPARVIRQAQT